MTGMVGNKWLIDHFAPMESILAAVCLTTYNSENFMETPLEGLAQQVAADTLKIQIGKVVHFDDIVEARPSVAAWRRIGLARRWW